MANRYNIINPVNLKDVAIYRPNYGAIAQGVQPFDNYISILDQQAQLVPQTLTADQPLANTYSAERELQLNEALDILNKKGVGAASNALNKLKGDLRRDYSSSGRMSRLQQRLAQVQAFDKRVEELYKDNLPQAIDYFKRGIRQRSGQLDLTQEGLQVSEPTTPKYYTFEEDAEFMMKALDKIKADTRFSSHFRADRPLTLSGLQKMVYEGTIESRTYEEIVNVLSQLVGKERMDSAQLYSNVMDNRNPDGTRVNEYELFQRDAEGRVLYDEFKNKAGKVVRKVPKLNPYSRFGQIIGGLADAGKYYKESGRGIQVTDRLALKRAELKAEADFIDANFSNPGQIYKLTTGGSDNKIRFGKLDKLRSGVSGSNKGGYNTSFQPSFAPGAVSSSPVSRFATKDDIPKMYAEIDKQIQNAKLTGDRDGLAQYSLFKNVLQANISQNPNNPGQAYANAKREYEEFRVKETEKAYLAHGYKRGGKFEPKFKDDNERMKSLILQGSNPVYVLKDGKMVRLANDKDWNKLTGGKYKSNSDVYEHIELYGSTGGEGDVKTSFLAALPIEGKAPLQIMVQDAASTRYEPIRVYEALQLEADNVYAQSPQTDGSFVTNSYPSAAVVSLGLSEGQVSRGYKALYHTIQKSMGLTNKDAIEREAERLSATGHIYLRSVPVKSVDNATGRSTWTKVSQAYLTPSAQRNADGDYINPGYPMFYKDSNLGVEKPYDFNAIKADRMLETSNNR